VVVDDSRHEATHTSRPFTGGVLFAALAAACFGVTTPVLEKLGRGVGPIVAAGWLYAGAALGSIHPFARRGREARVERKHLRRLSAVALLGAVTAPVCLIWGLSHTGAFGASLLLNFEAVFTVLLAWRWFHEPVGPRFAAAMALMFAGGVLLVVGGGGVGGFGWGAVGVVAATLAWALDNTLSRPLADLDPSDVVRWKGALGAAVSLALSLLAGQAWPSAGGIAGLLACGAVGYGVSLRCYLMAQRRIGAARTASVFAVAPFIGATTAWLAGERPGALALGPATALFALGMVLHLAEQHAHHHLHESLEHEHAHRHDDGHHQHVHDQPVEGAHSHVHRHEAQAHAHPHGPDLHHGHRHADPAEGAGPNR
jgi:drug/metabolite transporter (DMT)-like permease